MAAELWDAVQSMMTQLVEADNLAFARLVLTHFPGKHEDVTAGLGSTPHLQYR